jgi:hypothetical protein
MKTKLLLPNHFKRVGWILLVPSALLGLFVIILDYEFRFLDMKVFTIYSGSGVFQDPVFFGLIKANLTGTLVGILFLTGAIFVAFSEEKHEDEFIAKSG